jgi:glutamate-1-semialdehyde 2,1-aminomutase
MRSGSTDIASERRRREAQDFRWGEAPDIHSERRRRSEELFARAQELIPGGVNSPVRAMRSVGRDPLFVASAAGAEIEDVDGNRYVDYVCSWGPLILGHAHPEVVEAVQDAAARGTSYGAPTQGEVELAAEIVARVPGAEMARLTSSGTEAAMTAVRLARAATGRAKVIKFAGCYHGHVDGLLAESGSGLATQGIPASPGVTPGQAADTIVVSWNDPAALRAAAERVGGDLAAVIAEGIPANMGLVPAAPGFLEVLRETCDAHGALLVLDEVITGFRVGLGGAQEALGVRGDLVILGKVLGGGLPLAAVAGPRRLLEQLAPVGETYQAGTLSGNPLATAAGLATLRQLDADAYARLERTTERLARGLEWAAAEAGVAVQVPWVTGLLTVFFAADPVRDYAGARAADADAFARFFAAMLAHGVYLPPSAFEAWFPSLAHSDDVIDDTLEAAAEAFDLLAAGRG